MKPLTLEIAMQEGERTAPGIDLKGKKVLVADDEYINSELLTEILIERGMSVVTVSNGELAVAEFSRQNFDLVLMDIIMPVKGGYEAAREIRAFEKDRGSHTAIIAMTGFLEDEVRSAYLDSGMDGYILKPISWERMFNEIAHVLSEKSEQSDKTKKASAFDGLDYDKFINEMCNGNKMLAVKLVNQFISARVPELLQAVTAAVREQDIERLREICHSLIGVSGSMCAFEIAAATSELRQLAIDENWQAMPAILDKLRKLHFKILTWWEDVYAGQKGQ